MTKSEFITKLKEALENDIDGRAVQENVDFYSSYISDEIAKGRSEAEVLDELGDPWVIAQSVIDMEEAHMETASKREYDSGYESSESTRGRSSRGGFTGGFTSGGFTDDGFVTFKEIPKWKIFLAILGVIGVILIIITVIGGIISLLAPIVIPLIVIMFVLRRFRNQ